LPTTVTRQRRGCDLNTGPSAPESSTLTTRLPSQLNFGIIVRYFVDRAAGGLPRVDLRSTSETRYRCLRLRDGGLADDDDEDEEWRAAGGRGGGGGSSGGGGVGTRSPSSDGPRHPVRGGGGGGGGHSTSSSSSFSVSTQSSDVSRTTASVDDCTTAAIRTSPIPSSLLARPPRCSQ